MTAQDHDRLRRLYDRHERVLDLLAAIVAAADRGEPGPLIDRVREVLREDAKAPR